ncbi:Dephospho-CoA kinase domain-containing protein [Gracilariopsis chorda]|uniref:Dephospho-CoA kinase domain-containing protein n=1 Tax=Gracilariopsis chorda TaxID=448386 RepID=A0A2V3J2P3_9FLOR|nr:Dephospho-CoA kinase domain-containing protein [Gracilariopsis chorda]|eukprot:PXF48678.1 Dephospho-CoA kinase domain-containing protein [Gracilariopsis chorda]
MPKIVGLTGGIASGKSTVSGIWSDHDVTIIDADKIAREVVQPGKPAYWLIKRTFGTGVLHQDGTLNRRELGKLVFSNPGHRTVLNRITHPFIIFSMLSRLFVAVFIKWKTIVVLDTPLLFESGTLLPFCAAIVVVSCDPEQQLERMLKRDAHLGMTEDEANRRLASQIPLAEKARRATYVINNTGEMDQLRENAVHVLDRLKPSKAGEFAFRGLVLVGIAKIVFRLSQR